MKQLLILSISLFLISCSGKAQNKAVENQVNKNIIVVVINIVYTSIKIQV